MAELSLVSQHIPSWINYYLPGAIIFAALLWDLASSISIPKSIRTVLGWISSPFGNFLALEDLSEPVDFTPRSLKVKQRILVGLASVVFVGWAGCLVFGIYMDDRAYVVKSMVQLVSWVSTPCRVVDEINLFNGRVFSVISP